MIHWKISVLSVALGAVTTAGFVWLGRRARKVVEPDAEPTVDTAGAAELETRHGFNEQFDEQGFDAEEAARADAFHDFERADREPAARQEGGGEIVELMDVMDAESLDIDPVEVEPTDTELEISPLDEEPLSEGERYDAVDPESLGSEFLSRAIDAGPGSPHPLAEPFAPPAPDEGHPVRAARLARLDHAVELPVGTIDARGNVELHEPHPTPTESSVELPPTEEELERRKRAEAERNG